MKAEVFGHKRNIHNKFQYPFWPAIYTIKWGQFLGIEEEVHVFDVGT